MVYDSAMTEATVEPVSAVRTWADIDTEEAVTEQAEAVEHRTRQYHTLVQSIIAADVEPDERARLLTEAATGYSDRVETKSAYRPNAFMRFLGAKVTNGDGLGPDAFAVVGDPDKPSTWKLQINDKAHISGAIQALSPAGFRGEKAQLTPEERKAAIGRIRGAIGRLSDDDKGNLGERLDALKALTEPARTGSVVLLAGKAGTYDRFALWASNNFRDREGEIFPAAAIKAAVERFNNTLGVKGAVNVWHVGHPEYGWRGYPPSMSDWGEIEHAAYVDGFLFVEGRVTRPDIAAGIKAWGEREPLGTSMEYQYWASDLVDGVYSNFDFDRVSVLPRSVAANPWGPQVAVNLGKGETDMPFESQAQREALATLWGEDTVKAWEQEAETKATELRTQGHDAKSITVTARPPAVELTYAAKDDGASAAETTATPDGLSAPVTQAAEATPDEPPAWARTLLEQQAALLARQDQTDAAVKAITDEQGAQTGASRVLDLSVQHGGGTKERAIEEIKAADGPAKELEQWGIVGKIAAEMANGNKGNTPAGA